MQDNLQVVEAVETPVAAPVELSLEQLAQVAGGVTAQAVAGPNDNW